MAKSRDELDMFRMCFGSPLIPRYGIAKIIFKEEEDVKIAGKNLETLDMYCGDVKEKMKELLVEEYKRGYSQGCIDSNVNNQKELDKHFHEGYAQGWKAKEKEVEKDKVTHGTLEYERGYREGREEYQRDLIQQYQTFLLMLGVVDLDDGR